MEFAFEPTAARASAHTAARKPIPANADDSSSHESMKAGYTNPSTRKSPSRDQKKQRRQQAQNRRTASLEDLGEPMSHTAASDPWLSVVRNAYHDLTGEYLENIPHLDSVPWEYARSQGMSEEATVQALCRDAGKPVSIMDVMLAVDRAMQQSQHESQQSVQASLIVSQATGGQGEIANATTAAPKNLYKSCPKCGSGQYRKDLKYCGQCGYGRKTENKESSMTPTQHTEAELLQAMALATPEEQVHLIADLDALRRAQRMAAVIDTAEMWGDEITTDVLTPVMAASANSADTDWLGSITAHYDDPDIEAIANAMRAEAVRWYTRTSSAVRQDPEEFGAQLRGMAAHHASAHLDQWGEAFEAFTSHATHLRRTEYPEAHAAALELLALDHEAIEHSALPGGGSGGPNPQSGYGESSLPGEIKPADAPEVFPNFAPPVAPENAWIDEGDTTSDRMPQVQENNGGPSADANQKAGMVGIEVQAGEIGYLEEPEGGLGSYMASAGWWVFDANNAPVYGPYDTQFAAYIALSGAGITNTAGMHVGLGATFSDLLTQGRLTPRYPKVASDGPDVTRTSEEAAGSEPTDTGNSDPLNPDEMWPWELDANTPGTGAADVASTPTPGSNVADYPSQGSDSASANQWSEHKSTRVAFDIAKVRQVVADKAYTEVDGSVLDLFTASHILAVYDNLSPENQARFASLPLPQAADMAFKLLNKVKASMPTTTAQAEFRDKITLARMQVEAGGGLDNLGDSKAPPFGKDGEPKDDDDADDKKEAARQLVAVFENHSDQDIPCEVCAAKIPAHHGHRCSGTHRTAGHAYDNGDPIGGGWGPKDVPCKVCGKGANDPEHMFGGKSTASRHPFAREAANSAARDLKPGHVITDHKSGYSPTGKTEGTVHHVDTTSSPGQVYVYLGDHDVPADLVYSHGDPVGVR